MNQLFQNSFAYFPGGKNCFCARRLKEHKEAQRPWCSNASCLSG